MSFELPNDKISRTMPEQVAKNTKDIADLKTGYNQIANIEIQGGHLLLTLQGGEVFDAGVIKGISSMVLNSSRHLIVNYDDGTNADLGLIKGVSSFSINASQHLIVNYDNGTSTDLGAIFNGDITISGTLTLSTGNVNGNIIASGYLEQATPNFTKTVSFTSDVSGGTITNVYNRFIQIGNVLHLIVNVKITNNTAASISVSANGSVAACGLDIGSTVLGAKIFDIDGNTLNDTPLTNNTLIACVNGIISTSNVRNGQVVQGVCEFTNRTGVGNCQLQFYTKEALTIPPAGSIYLFARAALTLL